MRIVELVCGAAKAVDDDIFQGFDDDLNKRILFQKIIYLIQEKGYDMGFKFNWYLRGPYSSKLADYGYEISCNDFEFPQTSKLEMNGEAKDYVASLRSAIFSEESVLSPTENAELLASLHYLYSHNVGTKSLTKDEIINKLIILKNDFNKDQAFSAYDKLEKLGLLK